MAHTPGPWVWRWKSGSLHRVGTGDHAYGDTVLAPTCSYEEGPSIEVSHADDRLIKTAPDLLEALLGATSSLVAAISLLERGGKKAAASDKMLNDYSASVEKARAAIIKATDGVSP